MGQLTLQQLRRFGLTPDTGYGQHFLADDNILRVIGMMAALGGEDTVYEPGAGVGVLSAFLAERAGKVYSVELDRRLQPALDFVVQHHPRIELIWGDALQVDVAAFDPLPDKLISNLPYNVAAPIIAEALQCFPFLTTYCVMVQKEVGDRLFAKVGASNYGALSVLVQSVATRTRVHKVSRSVFVPPPNVDSVLVAFDRDLDLLAAHEVAPFAAFTKVAFMHRRKTLANNLEAPREDIVAALAELGKAPAARPQELTAGEFVALWKAVA